MSFKENLVLLDNNSLVEIVNKNPFFRSVIQEVLEEDASKENIINAEIENTIWYHDGDLVIDENFNFSHNISDNLLPAFANATWYYAGSTGIEEFTPSSSNLPDNRPPLFVNGNLIVKNNIYMANMDIVAVSGNIKAESAIFQNVILIVEQNMEISNGIFWGDNAPCYIDIRGTLETPQIVFVTNGRFTVNNISKNTLGIIGYNSSGRKGNEKNLRDLSLERVIMIDNLPEYKEAENSFDAFNLMIGNITNK